MSDKENKQPLSENEAAEEEKSFEYDRTLCSLCQKKAREEGSYYCEDCRTKMMKTKIKGGPVVAALLCVLVSLLALMILGANATQISAMLEADSLMNQGYVNAALNKVSQASEANAALNKRDFVSNLSKTLGNQTIFTLGYSETVMTARLYARGYSEIDAGGYLVNNLGEDAVKSDARLLGVRKYVKAYNSYNTMQEKAYSILQNYINSDAKDIPYDELIEKLEALRGQEGVDDKYIDYYKCFAAMQADKSIDVQLGFLLKMEKEYPEGLMIYGPTITDYYYRSGDYAKAIEYADKMIAKNRNYYSAYEQKVTALLAKGDVDGAAKVCDALDTAENAAGVASGDYTSYSLRANLYWYTGKYDEAIKVCEEGLEASGGDSDIYRNEAIAYMLKGDYKKANECGKAAYQFSMNYGDLTLDILNTAALAAGLAKDDETYKSMQDYLKTYNYEVSSVVTDCLAGKKTVEQVFITDGGVIS